MVERSIISGTYEMTVHGKDGEPRILRVRARLGDVGEAYVLARLLDLGYHAELAPPGRRDGRWAGTADLGYVDGKRIRKTVYGKTNAEVVRKLQDLQHRIDSNRPVQDATVTFARYLAEWLDERVDRSTEPRRPGTRIAIRPNDTSCHRSVTSSSSISGRP